MGTRHCTPWRISSSIRLTTRRPFLPRAPLECRPPKRCQPPLPFRILHRHLLPLRILPRPLSPSRPPPPRLYLNRARNLQAALESRTVVDIAVGIIMAQNGCSQESAVEILRSVSNTRNIKIRSVAAGVVAAVSDRVRTHFEE